MGFFDGLLGGGDTVQPGMQLGDVGADGKAVPVQQVGDPAYDRQTMELAQAYGMHPALVQQAQAERQQAILGNLGATLLAAGQRGPVGQRGQILSKMDLSGGEPISKSLLNSAQMQLYAQNVKDKQQEASARAQALAQIKKLGLSPAQQAGAMVDPVGFLKQQAASELAIGQAKSTAQATYEQKVQQLVAAGMPEDRARALASGAIGEGKGMLGQTVLTDFRTTPMGGGGIPTLGGGMSGGATGDPAPATGGGPAPASAAPATGTNMPTVDYSKAFGPSSGFQGAINDVSGTLLSGPTFPKTQQAEMEINQLNHQIATTLSSGTGPRGNTTYAAKGVAGELPEPGHMFSNPSKAYDQYGAVAARVDDEIKNLKATPITSAADYQKAQTRLTELTTLRNRIGVVLGSWGQAGNGAAPAQKPPGITDGATAYNPKTGHQIVFRGGKWTEM